MEILVKELRETGSSCDALVLPFTEGGTDLYKDLPVTLTQLIRKAFSRKFSGKMNEVILMPSPSGIKPEWIALTGMGKIAEVSAERLRQAGGKTASALAARGMKKISLSTGVISSLGLSPADFAEGCLLGQYSFTKYRKEDDRSEIKSLTILAKPLKDLRDRIGWLRTLSSAVHFSRDLVNTPSNDMTPSRLATAARSLTRKGVSVKVLEKKDCHRLGMGAFLAVAKGSNEPPKFIIVEYKGSSTVPLVLIGKSITFDSGGISLKPADGMEKMKYDMAGGAAVLGAIKAVSEAGLPVHIIGILPATENLPGGSATRPGDIVKAISGKTIEITNTDAEGRLVLADAIGYAARLKPRAVLDIATLTGACSIALGNEAMAMMGNDRRLLDQIRASSEATYERAWEMPLFDEYKDYLKSDFADINNTGGRTGSLVTSAYFLKEFAGDIPWVHLDIAGTAWVEKERPYIPKGASGIGVRLISHFIKEMK